MIGVSCVCSMSVSRANLHVTLPCSLQDEVTISSSAVWDFVVPLLLYWDGSSHLPTYPSFWCMGSWFSILRYECMHAWRNDFCVGFCFRLPSERSLLCFKLLSLWYDLPSQDKLYLPFWMTRSIIVTGAFHSVFTNILFEEHCDSIREGRWMWSSTLTRHRHKNH